MNKRVMERISMARVWFPYFWQPDRDHHEWNLCYTWNVANFSEVEIIQGTQVCM